MQLYHRTDAGEAILRDGFRDGTGSYGLASLTLTGVFVSDEVLTLDEGAVGRFVLAIETPDDVELDEWEIIEDGKPYREWCVPAAVLNQWPVREAEDPYDVGPLEPPWQPSG